MTDRPANSAHIACNARRALHVLCALVTAISVSNVTAAGQIGDATWDNVFTPSTPEDVLNGGSDVTEKFSLASRPSTEFPEVDLTNTDLTKTISSCRRPCYRNRVLPAGLLYRSYIAAPHEPRFSSALLFDSSSGDARWDASLGARMGIFRRDNPPRMNMDAWQIDLEGAAITRLNPQEKMDVEAVDYRFGLQWTGKRDNLAFKFGYFHISSHVGDEFLIKNPAFQRINYVRESLIFGTSLQATPECRVYGEIGWAMFTSGGAEPWQFQTGAEYSRLATRPTRGAPFTALNLQMRQEVDFAPGVSILAGWQWKGPETGRTMRIGLQFFNGPSNQYSFYEEYDQQLGLGVWYDF